MKNIAVDFSTLSVGDEFVFDGSCFMVVIRSGNNPFGTAMSIRGRMVKFHGQDQVRQV